MKKKASEKKEKKTKIHEIETVREGSIAWELELSPGDQLISINGQAVEDIFDYQYLTHEEYLELLVRKPDGEEWELEIEKEYGEDLGLEFASGLMDEYRSCRNRCIFCFIDQMPEGMRDTLYFKDDDSRLSFLQGNYVTLTNMDEEDVERIIRYHLSPINISFHTTNPELRCRMLNNRFAGEALKKVDRLFQAGIVMNGQIVLCKGINDGEELKRSIEDLTRYVPQLESLSVVPVGLTRHREGLYPLVPFTRQDAREVLEIIHGWQKRLFQEQGTHFVHASDEWYILAGEELPGEETYDGYLQLENGVGMLRLLEEEVETTLQELSLASCQTKDGRAEGARRLSIATGLLAAPYLAKHMERIREQFPYIEVQVIPVRNAFFGEQITVAGLLTGQDLAAQLRDRDLGEELLLSQHLLRRGEDVFLDDMTVEQLQKTLQVPITIVKSDGKALVRAVTGKKS
ncbi:MAG: DUF512 domain-containing protein [Lachnospiraceae bacterium]|nr:DUF512 domain-containing protein [Lachnospiraceae bacterium]